MLQRVIYDSLSGETTPESFEIKGAVLSTVVVISTLCIVQTRKQKNMEDIPDNSSATNLRKQLNIFQRVIYDSISSKLHFERFEKKGLFRNLYSGGASS